MITDTTTAKAQSKKAFDLKDEAKKALEPFEYLLGIVIRKDGVPPTSQLIIGVKYLLGENRGMYRLDLLDVTINYSNTHKDVGKESSICITREQVETLRRSGAFYHSDSDTYYMGV